MEVFRRQLDSGVEFRGEDRATGKNWRIAYVSVIFQVAALGECVWTERREDLRIVLGRSHIYQSGGRGSSKEDVEGAAGELRDSVTSGSLLGKMSGRRM